jgi:hypothetical protein
MKTFISLVTLLLFALSTNGQQAATSVTLGDTLDARQVQNVVISGARGMKVSVRGYDGNRVIYKWTVSGSGEQFDRVIRNSSADASVQQGTLTIRISTVAKDGYSSSKSNEESWIKQLISPSKGNRPMRSGEQVLQIFEVLVPASCKFELESSIAEVQITGMTNGLKIENRSGSVRITSTKGDLSVDNQYGATEVSEHIGAAVVRGRSGTITTSETTGRLNVNSDYSTIRVTRHNGTLSTENESGKTIIEEVDGDVTVRGKYGAVEVSEVTGKTDIVNNSGSVEVSDAKAVNVTNLNGSVTLTKIKSAVSGTIQATNGSVSLTRVEAPLLIDTKNGSLESKDGAAKLTVITKNGSIRIDRHKGDLELRGGETSITLHGIQAEEVILANGNRNIEAQFDRVGRVDIVSEGPSIRLDYPGKIDGAVDIEVTEGTITGNAFSKSQITASGGGERVKTGIGREVLKVRLKRGELLVRVSGL